MLDTEAIVLSGCLRKTAGFLKNKVRREFFTDPFNQQVFDKAIVFYAQNGKPMSKAALQASFENATEEQKIRLDVLLGSFDENIDESFIIQHADNLKVKYQLTQAKEVATKIINDEYKDFSHLLNESRTVFSNVEALTGEVPRFQEITGAECATIFSKEIDEYHDPESNQRLYTGIEEIDDVTGGAFKGRFWNIAAIAHQGKTAFLANYCYNLIVNQKKNCCFFTTEMGMGEMRAVFFALHAYRKMNMPFMDTFNLFRGTMSDSDRKKLKEEVVTDFTSGKYGKLFLMPAGQMTIEDINMRTLELHRTHPIDALFLDYASKLRPIQKRRTEMEEIDDTIKYLEYMKLNFGGQENGIFICNGHQINREGEKIAEKTLGHFGFRHLSLSNKLK